MIATNPFFTLIIPTYNRARLIGTTLQSVLAQTFTDFELIVIDDGGKDNTEEVIQKLGSHKITFYRKENGERGAARNFGWHKARGKYVTFLDSDDVVYPSHFQDAYEFLKGHNFPVCGAQAYEIKEAQTNKVLTPAYQVSSGTINEALLKGNFLSCFGVFIRKEVGNELHFEEDRRFAGTEDWLLWLQLAARYPFYYNNAVTGALLEHDSRSVLSFNEESLLFRTEGLKQKLEADAAFINRFGQTAVKKIYAHMLSYTSLHLAMSKNKNGAWQYLVKALRVNGGELLTRRSIAITKKLLFS